MHCTRHNCSTRNGLVVPGQHGTDPDTGLPTCWKCGDYLSEAPLPLRHRMGPPAPAPVYPEPAPYPEPALARLLNAGHPPPPEKPRPFRPRVEPWEGSWGRVGDNGWGLRIYMPDNDHRDDDPEEGQKIRVTTRKGRVSLYRLGPLLTKTRTTYTFAAPPRD